MRLEEPPPISPTSIATGETSPLVEIVPDPGPLSQTGHSQRVQAPVVNVIPSFPVSPSSFHDVKLEHDAPLVNPGDDFGIPPPQLGVSNEGTVHSLERGIPNPGPSQTQDIIHKIPNLFRLLDLVEDRGSGGIVEKIVIDQPSLHELINTLQPGSYDSVSKINFKSLDNLSIKPVGVYGDQSEILQFLKRVGCLDDISMNILAEGIKSEESPSKLRSGLYLIMGQGAHSHGPSELGYLVYWPEDTTWDDQASSLSDSIRRNRETFIRYLNKLADQVVALVSPSQADAFVWKKNAQNQAVPRHQQMHSAEARVHDFEVFELNEQEEDVIASPGFTVLVENVCCPLNDSKFTGTTPSLVAGEGGVGVVVKTRKPAYVESVEWDKNMTCDELYRLIQSSGDQPNLMLGNVSQGTMKTLDSNGLRERYPFIFKTYDERVTSVKNQVELREQTGKKQIQDHTEHDNRELLEEIQYMVRLEYSNIYPTFQVIPAPPHGPDISVSLRERYSNIGLSEIEEHIQQRVHRIKSKSFRLLKSKWLSIRDRLNNNADSPENNPTTIVNNALKEASSAINLMISGPTQRILDLIPGEESPSDSEFISDLHQRTEACSALQPFLDRTYSQLRRSLEKLDDSLQSGYLKKMVAEAHKSRRDALNEECGHERQSQLKEAFDTLVESLRQSMEPGPTDRPQFCLESVAYLRGNTGHWLSVRGVHTVSVPSQDHYNIYPLELTEHDRHQIHEDDAYIPQPRLTRNMFAFSIPIDHSVEFMQLVGEKCLLVISDNAKGQTRIYIEDNITLERSIHTSGKVTLYHSQLGSLTRHFAFDKTTRQLAVIHGQEDLRLSIFMFDELFTDLRRLGSPIFLHEWYKDPPALVNVCFQSGRISPELCFVETSGRIRIFSLKTQMFRGAELKLGRPVSDAFPAPDGSCLLVIIAGATISSPDKLLAFHWESFDQNQPGINCADLPLSEVSRAATRFNGRGRIHVVSFGSQDKAVTSTALEVKQKASEFFVRSDQESSPQPLPATSNNGLIDCHMEAWTRFPVVPAVTRSTLSALARKPRRLTFVSSVPLPEVVEYYASMIVQFKNTTQKPVDAELDAIVVSSQSSMDAESGLHANTSEFRLGSFIVELLCLIPLHLAITMNNKFMPLKDGVWDPEHERKLVGATISELIDSLSLGWYESLLQSYMATKPVRVVSSMGEQSVGKSYCLNHFADTSFAGSAMRTTEGIWLSCTPTTDYLLISLDFEGMQSIERSPQEDMLLVLFNTALSNLVLFRNNFALSRNITGLFTSFQLSARTFDPSRNPTLFNSNLAIIIKDVTDADSRKIVQEFALRFRNIVQLEQDRNFITQLHRGKFQIIPWPVINSPGFYSLFDIIKQRLDQQPFTHQTGGAFLHKLKTLLVKIKTSNWDAMDQSLASSRAQQLKERLQNALSSGVTMEGPLKNMDTDEDIPTLESQVIFFVPNLGDSGHGVDNSTENERGEYDSEGKLEEIAEASLKVLIEKCGPPLASRPHMADRNYVDALQESLYQSFECRKNLVQSWIHENTKHLSPENAGLRDLHGRFNVLTRAMKAAVRLCQSGCSNCNLLCLRSYRHSGEHDCGTNHKCVFDCDVTEAHSQGPSPVCGLRAGHEGRHMCAVRKHSCGKECHLGHLTGCTIACNKPLDHSGDHCCSARVHFCGKPCDLREASRGPNQQAYTCSGRCQQPWDEPHERHTCDNARTCPLPCALCIGVPGRTSSCANDDHFHGLNPNQVHLCGAAHKCPELCEKKGICGIDLEPSKCETQFSGKHTTFTYTRYTQVSKRHPCNVEILPWKMSHGGLHTHDSGPNSFHYCDARCPGCNYLCTQPLGHSQPLHKTSHGSMIGGQWIIEAQSSENADPTYEIDNQVYGQGDEGTTMFCHMMCTKQGRHVHVDFCRDPDNHEQPLCKHVPTKPSDSGQAKDWISHATYWERTGFEDPYSKAEQNDYSKCNYYCAGPEHEGEDQKSWCTLPIFHPPQGQLPRPTHGHISKDGHHFDCPDPSLGYQAYHVVFLIDTSGSMWGNDKHPVPDLPITDRLIQECNNRYGAVVSALYCFWTSQAKIASRSLLSARKDAYSLVTFDDYTQVKTQNDFKSTAEQLVDFLLPQQSNGWFGGTNFDKALKAAQEVIEQNWSNERAPVIVFLSDGECSVSDNILQGLCNACIQRGHALSFYSILFGQELYSSSLRKMVDLAEASFRMAPLSAKSNFTGQDIPCKYSNAIDSVQLMDKFLGISEAISNMRASVINRAGASGRRF